MNALHPGVRPTKILQKVLKKVLESPLIILAKIIFNLTVLLYQLSLI